MSWRSSFSFIGLRSWQCSFVGGAPGRAGQVPARPARRKIATPPEPLTCLRRAPPPTRILLSGTFPARACDATSDATRGGAIGQPVAARSIRERAERPAHYRRIGYPGAIARTVSRLIFHRLHHLDRPRDHFNNDSDIGPSRSRSASTLRTFRIRRHAIRESAREYPMPSAT